MDLLRLEIFKNRLSSVAEEMGEVLRRSAFSPNIKERKDISCAIFDAEGRLIAQAAHIPVHLGSMMEAVKSAIKDTPMEEGDMVLLNDPYRGGTHLPDLTLVAPVDYQGKRLFYVACRAHHADVGGVSAGSMPLSEEIFQEGLIIPPVRIVRRGEIDEDILKLICTNTRTPEERKGDLKAQIIANSVGSQRLKNIISEWGVEETLKRARSLIDYAERLMRSKLEKIPDGTYTFTDYLEDDGLGREKIAIRVKLEIKGSDAVVDFSETDPQVEGPMNAVRSITLASVFYAFRCLLDEDAPTNEGCFKPIKVITKKGTVVDAEFPRSVAGGNVETSQRIVDVVLGALSKALPDFIPSASQGTMNNVAIGGFDPIRNKPFTYYETIGGGMGAWKGGDGESAVHSHMTNTMNTPVEALEHAYPLRVVRYSVRRNSGGEGTYRGGDGIVRELEFLSDAQVTILSERRRIPPYGLFGGKPGSVGRNILITEKETKILPSKFSLKVKKGWRLRIETPGGGGYA